MPSPEIPGDEALAARYRPRIVAEVDALHAPSQAGAGEFGHCADCEWFIGQQRLDIDLDLDLAAARRMERTS